MKFFGAFVALTLLSAGSFAFGAEREFRPNELIVKFRPSARSQQRYFEKIYALLGATHVQPFSGVAQGFQHIRVSPGTDLKAVLRELRKEPGIELAQPNYIVGIQPLGARVGAAASAEPAVPCMPGFMTPGCVNVPCLYPGIPAGCGESRRRDAWGEEDASEDSDLPPNALPLPRGFRPHVGPRPPAPLQPQPDPRSLKAESIRAIGAPEAWKVASGSSDLVVAVIDTGIDYNHPDLSANIWRKGSGQSVGWDYTNGDSLPYDDNGHGTHVAGIIGAVGKNGVGISGVCPQVSLMALKFLDRKGLGDTVLAIRAIEYAVDHGARIINASWGGAPDVVTDDALLAAIRKAEDKDVLFVTVAGNEGVDDDSVPMYPASFNLPNLVVVTAAEKDGSLSRFANFGRKTVHLGAPGRGIYSTFPGSRYRRLSGTSMAAPHVTGAAALIWASNPKLTSREVKAKLLDSVDAHPSFDGRTVSGGRLNVARAIEE